MRIKLYYTTDDITNNLYTSGGEWMLESNLEYIGLYHRYTTGEIYTGAIWDAKTSQKLITYQKINNKLFVYNTLKSINVKYPAEPITSIVSITNKDKQAGFVTRYFIKKTNEFLIIEIDSKQYDMYQSNKFDVLLYTSIQLNWTITGEVADTTVNGVLIRGVQTKNNSVIRQAEKQLPGISTILTDPLQYYSDTDFVVPKDINS